MSGLSERRDTDAGRRFLRRVARRLLPRGAWLSPGVRQVLGVHRADGHAVDRVDGFAVEFALESVIGELLFFRREFEREELELLRARLESRPGAVVLDVGANIGWHSLHAARLPSVARVHAFEPGRETFRMLQRNLERNAVAIGRKVIAYPVAVGQRSSEATFHYCADNAYSSLHPDQRQPVIESYSVSVVSLDDWAVAHRLDRVDLVKIDVEGGEPDVIAGASEMLARYRPELMVEIFQGTRQNYSATDLITRIRSLGYEAFVLEGGRSVPFTTHCDAHFNYHFVPR